MKTKTKTAALPVVKFKEDTLLAMGFYNRSETVCHLPEKELNHIGSMLHRRGLIDQVEDWWLTESGGGPLVRFSCGGRDYQIEVTHYVTMEGRWRVAFTKGPDELEQWLEKRPEGHPERTSHVEMTLPASLLKRLMKAGKAQGIDSFEDYTNMLVSAEIERSKGGLAA